MKNKRLELLELLEAFLLLAIPQLLHLLVLALFLR